MRRRRLPRVRRAAETTPGIADAGARPGPSVLLPAEREQSRCRNIGTETAKGEVAYEELSKLQSTIARRMAESKATAPHFYLEAEIDMSRAVEAADEAEDRRRRGRGRALLQRHGRQGLRAGAARAPARQRRLPRRPLRALLAGQRRRSRSPPATRSSCRRSSTPTARACGRSPPSRGRSGRRSATARSRRPSSPARTFTVSNLGMFGIDSFAAVINPPAGGDPRRRRDQRARRSSATARSPPPT